jgi:hypothetical protein
MISGGGLTLQISEVPAKIVLDQFLLEAKIRAVGVLDTSLNNEDYNYVTVVEAVATPWLQTNPIKPIGYPEGYLKISDIVMVYPLESDVQQRIQLMPHSQRGVFYLGSFIIQGNLSVGADMGLSEAMESLLKRFLVATEVSLFPMFPANTALPDQMPVVLLNRAKIYQYHGIQG